MGVNLGLLKALCGQTWNSYDLLQGLSCPLRTTWGGEVVLQTISLSLWALVFVQENTDLERHEPYIHLPISSGPSWSRGGDIGNWSGHAREGVSSLC